MDQEPERKSFFASSQKSWRDWLIKNHQTEDYIWLIIYKKKSKIPSVYYSEAVDEALCFGWIDSKPNKRDADSYYLPRGQPFLEYVFCGCRDVWHYRPILRLSFLTTAESFQNSERLSCFLKKPAANHQERSMLLPYPKQSKSHFALHPQFFLCQLGSFFQL